MKKVWENNYGTYGQVQITDTTVMAYDNVDGYVKVYSGNLERTYITVSVHL